MFSQGQFLNDANATPESIARKRAMIAALMPRFGSAKFVGEGLGQLATGVMIGRQNKKLDGAEAAGRKSAEDMFSGLLGSGGSAEPGGFTVTGQPGSASSYAPSQPAPPRDPNSPDAVAADTMFALGKINPQDREILAKTLMAEAGGEGYGGMLAAGAVIDNRRESGGYGDGLEGVIMKPGQFSAWNGVTGYAGGEGALNMSTMSPSEDAYAAADAILTGNYEDPTGGATHYYNPNVANPKWGQAAGGDWTAIGNHVFGSADAGRSGDVPQGAPAPAGANATTPQIPMQDILKALADPWLAPEQKAVLQSIYEQQVQAGDPMRQLELQKSQLELAQLQNPTDAPPEAGFAPMSPEEVQSLGLPPGAYQRGPNGEIKQIGGGGTNVTVNNTPGAQPSDEALRKKLMEVEGIAWGEYLKAGSTASGMQQDMALLDQVIELAPQGPVSGRLAEMFPGVSDAAGVFQSVVKRVAPSLRVEGSGSQSDIEYNGFLQSLPALSNRPEANRAIAAFLKSKAQVNMDRGAAVAAYQNGEIDATEARKRIQEIDSRSIMTPEVQSLLGSLGEAQGGEIPVGTVEDGFRYIGGDPALQESWEPVQ